MSADLPPLYVVRVRPCIIHAGRFRWDIRNVNDGDRPVRSSEDSYPTVGEAKAAAQGALQELASITG
jgi:hypothetical protein